MKTWKIINGKFTCIISEILEDHQHMYQALHTKDNKNFRTFNSNFNTKECKLNNINIFANELRNK